MLCVGGCTKFACYMWENHQVCHGDARLSSTLITNGRSGPPPPCQGGRCAALEPLDAQGHGPYLHHHYHHPPLRDPAHPPASDAASQCHQRCDRRACPASRDGRLRLFFAAAFAATCRSGCSGCRGCSGCGGLAVRHQPKPEGGKRWQGAHVAAAAASRALCAERRVHAVRRHVEAARLAVHMHCTRTAQSHTHSTSLLTHDTHTAQRTAPASAAGE